MVFINTLKKCMERKKVYVNMQLEIYIHHSL